MHWPVIISCPVTSFILLGILWVGHVLRCCAVMVNPTKTLYIIYRFIVISQAH